MTRTVSPRDLSRGEKKKLQRSKDFADLAETIVAREYDLDGRQLDPEWWDLHDPDRDTKHQVKSTSSTVGDKFPGDGRFRVWEGQTRSLIRSDAAEGHTAWYTFVLFDEDAGLFRIRRARPSTVNRWVRERGGWNQSGHESQGRQHKLPHGVVFS